MKFRIGEVKSVATDNPNGEFEIVMSTDSVDRDGEIIVKGAFDPLPASIPVHAYHNFDEPIGLAFPEYDTAGRLVGRGFFGSDEDSQKMRQKVTDGLVGHTSVGFMAADREVKDGVPHITKAELLEVSFVSVPSNRDAAVLAVKTYNEAIGKAAESVDTDLRSRVAQLEEQVKSLIGKSATADAQPKIDHARLTEVLDDQTSVEIMKAAAEALAVDKLTGLVPDGRDAKGAAVARLRQEIAAAQAATVL